jgi:hypothetical protein
MAVARGTPTAPSRNRIDYAPPGAVIQTYKGFVDAVHDGIAYLSLEGEHDQRLELEWDAVELASQSIAERQPFILCISTRRDSIQFRFAPDRAQPLSDPLLQEINVLAAHYRSTGELDDDGE